MAATAQEHSREEPPHVQGKEQWLHFAGAAIKRWQEYREELYKKDLHDQDHHDGVITHLEPDILECEVRWALGKRH